MIIDILKKRIHGRNLRIAFTDTQDERVYQAIPQILEEDLGRVVLVGQVNKELFREEWKPHVESILPLTHPDLRRYAEEYCQLRKHKGMTLEQALTVVEQPHYFAAFLLKEKKIDGIVSGLSSETKPFLPAFQVIGVREDLAKASSFFLMERENQHYIFSDCGLQEDPTAEELAEIGIVAAESASQLGIEPRVAFLSYSTLNSATHPLVEKVEKAVLLARRKNPSLDISGEVQLDAAINPSAAALKNAGKGNANVLVFPDLNAGNICYKAVEYLGGFTATGPILQGLKQPVNDLSRGSSVESIVNVYVLTALQAL